MRFITRFKFLIEKFATDARREIQPGRRASRSSSAPSMFTACSESPRWIGSHRAHPLAARSEPSLSAPGVIPRSQQCELVAVTSVGSIPCPSAPGGDVQALFGSFGSK
jgi:hypothetical protein